MINVPKWPGVTGRPSPLTALKRGHLDDHPSLLAHGETTLHTPWMWCVFMGRRNKDACNYLVYNSTHKTIACTCKHVRHIQLVALVMAVQ